MAGRLTITDIEKFKSDLVDAIINDWRLQADRLKAKFEAEIAQMPFSMTQPEFHNPRETKMQAIAL